MNGTGPKRQTHIDAALLTGYTTQLSRLDSGEDLPRMMLMRARSSRSIPGNKPTIISTAYCTKTDLIANTDGNCPLTDCKATLTITKPLHDTYGDGKSAEDLANEYMAQFSSRKENYEATLKALKTPAAPAKEEAEPAKEEAPAKEAPKKAGRPKKVSE